jgi:hypothetical protein
MSKINYLATVGCSHSSHYTGKSWPNFLSEYLGCELKMAYSSGAGNEMNTEKVKILVDSKPDLLIVQLTDPARYVVGITNSTGKKLNLENHLIDSHWINESCYYTFNLWENNSNIEKLVGRYVDVDSFILNHVLLSDYNMYYKVMHTISSMAFLAFQQQIPIVFFSWSVDINLMIKQYGYDKIFNNLMIIPGYIEEFVKVKDLKPIPKGELGEGHHGPANQKVIAEQFILPYLKEKNLI